MKEIEMFYLTGCPYCRNAEKAIEALIQEKPAYASVSIRRIEESLEPDLTEGRDYYYVPTFFLGEKKLYEAKPGQGYDEIKSNVRRCLEEAMNS